MHRCLAVASMQLDRSPINRCIDLHRCIVTPLINTYILYNNNIIIILCYIDIELQESANSNNHFSMLWFTLTAHWSMGSSSFVSKLQTPETMHSEGTETEGNSGRRDFSLLIPANSFKNMFSGTLIRCLLVGKIPQYISFK